MNDYHAYIARNGSLIVARYNGPAARQQIWQYIRREIGIISAPDLITARTVARRLDAREVVK